MKKSKFNLSHQLLTTCNFGTLVPVLCQECLPGDTFRISTEMFTRFQALVAPVMQRVDAKLEYFFVPNRIIYGGWRDYITDRTQQMLPVVSSSQIAGTSMHEKCSLFDYLGYPVAHNEIDDQGVPTRVAPTWDNANALPLIAYQRIWYDWYADQNIQASDCFQLEDQGGDFDRALSGQVNATIYGKLRQRAYPRDYFTSALPWAQAGDAARVPLSYPSTTSSMRSSVTNGDVTVVDGTVKVNGTTSNFRFGSPERIVTGPTIETLRRTSAIQRWLEANARYGRRYIEQIAAHFGVRVPDYRLDRSEYLGSNKAPITISEVLQQSQTTETSPLGDFAGHAVSGGVASMRKYRCSEHGYLFCILSFVPRASYSFGMARYLHKTSYLDFAFPEFDRIGEQPIYKAEVDSGDDWSTPFGYVPRYWEYKRAYDRFNGDFQDDLAHWHLGRLWSQDHQPALNPSFITIDGGQDGVVNDRIFAVQDGNNTSHILVQLYHHISAIRPLSNKPPKL